MSVYLIDTMLLSELRRRERDPAVVAWIARQRSTDPAFAEELAAWLNRLLRLHHERLLARDLPCPSPAAGDSSRPPSATTAPIC